MKCLFDTGDSNKVQSTYDGAVYDIAVGQDCVCGDIGDEFDFEHSSSSLQITFLAGSEAIVGGAFFKVDENKTITLQANSSIYLCCRIDKSQPNGQRAMFYQATQQSMQHGNLNGNDNVRDLLLYVITTGANGVLNVQDRRNIRTASSQSIGNLSFWTGTLAQYNAIAQKDNNTLYFIKE